MNVRRKRRRKAVIIDMDGTLAFVKHLRHYVIPTAEHPWKDFDSFHRESVDAPPNQEVVEMARQFAADGYAVLIVTARRAMYRHYTAWWLALHGVPSDAMFMRGNTDGRPDYEVKADILRAIEQSFDVCLAVDDNPAVIRLWNENNIPTIVIPGWGEEN